MMIKHQREDLLHVKLSRETHFYCTSKIISKVENHTFINLSLNLRTMIASKLTFALPISVYTNNDSSVYI